MAAAAILKITKIAISPYLRSGLTDLYDIWYADANGSLNRSDR